MAVAFSTRPYFGADPNAMQRFFYPRTADSTLLGSGNMLPGSDLARSEAVWGPTIGRATVNPLDTRQYEFKLQPQAYSEDQTYVNQAIVFSVNIASQKSLLDEIAPIRPWNGFKEVVYQQLFAAIPNLDRVPELGHARSFTKTVTSNTQSMVRHAIYVRQENGFAATPQGQRELALNIAIMSASTVQTALRMSVAAFRTLPIRRPQEFQLAYMSGWSNAATDVVSQLDGELRIWNIVAQGKDRAYETIGKTVSALFSKDGGASGGRIYIPEGLSTIADSNLNDYYKTVKGGQVGWEGNVMEKELARTGWSIRTFGSIQGESNKTPSNPLVNPRTVGSHFDVNPSATMTAEQIKKFTGRIALRDWDKNGISEIDLRETYIASGLFTHSGHPGPVFNKFFAGCSSWWDVCIKHRAFGWKFETDSTAAASIPARANPVLASGVSIKNYNASSGSIPAITVQAAVEAANAGGDVYLSSAYSKWASQFSRLGVSDIIARRAAAAGACLLIGNDTTEGKGVHITKDQVVEIYSAVMTAVLQEYVGGQMEEPRKLLWMDFINVFAIADVKKISNGSDVATHIAAVLAQLKNVNDGSDFDEDAVASAVKEVASKSVTKEPAGLDGSDTDILKKKWDFNSPADAIASAGLDVMLGLCKSGAMRWVRMAGLRLTQQFLAGSGLALQNGAAETWVGSPNLEFGSNASNKSSILHFSVYMMTVIPDPDLAHWMHNICVQVYYGGGGCEAFDFHKGTIHKTMFAQLDYIRQRNAPSMFWMPLLPAEELDNCAWWDNMSTNPTGRSSTRTIPGTPVMAAFYTAYWGWRQHKTMPGPNRFDDQNTNENAYTCSDWWCSVLNDGTVVESVPTKSWFSGRPYNGFASAFCLSGASGEVYNPDKKLEDVVSHRRRTTIFPERYMTSVI